MLIDNRKLPPEEWNKTFGGSKKDGGYDVQQSSDGGYILAGVTSSFGYGNDDVWLIKTNELGDEQWNRTYGSTRFESAKSVLQTSDGCYTVLGITSSYGAGGWDMWLIKTDANGNELWNCSYGGDDTDWARSLYQTSDGGYILIGYTQSYGAGGEDVWLVKTDANGNEEWNKTYGGTDRDKARDGQITSDGGFIITGNTRHTDETKTFLIKTDSFGIEEWNKTYHESGFESSANSVWETIDGGYIICGAKGVFLVSCGVFLLKTDEFGNEQWNVTLEGQNDDWGLSIQQVDDGGYIIAGEIKDERYYSEVLLLKTDVCGNEQWNKTFSRTLHSRGQTVKQTNDGGYIITGETDFYGPELGNVWLIKVARENHPPNTPIIDGPISGNAGVTYYYNFTINDIDGDPMFLWVDWDDGTQGPYIGPYESGEDVVVSHTWDEQDTYTIKARAKDTDNLWGPWGELEVTMPVNQQSTHPWFYWLLERFPNMFPILRHLIESQC